MDTFFYHDGEQTQFANLEYREGIYSGYRFYETAYADAVGEDAKEEAYSNVLYPFGYGLSYTEFEWKLDNVAETAAINSADQTITMRAWVKNTGDVAGKEVVQLYGHAPYTAGGIEKSDVVLLDFAKTELLEPGAEEVVTLTFDPYYLASYDDYDKNGNGFKGYELDGGDYELYISHDAHVSEFTVPFTVANSGIRYENDPVTNNPVVNRYTDCENEMFNSDLSLETVLSRGDWDGTWPASPTLEERTVGYDMLDALLDTSHNNPTDFSQYDYPDSDMDYGMTLRDMMYDPDGGTDADGKPNEYINPDENGRPYVALDDERWSTLIDQLAITDMIHVYNTGAYVIEPLEKIGSPRINCSDGPVGWACFMDKNRFFSTCSYCCQTLVATTWSKDVAYGFGQMVGDEGIVGAKGYDESPYSGWYAPGANIHRSPFGGRNFEYYSEDGVLSGIMAANQIQGCLDKGVFCFIKHFAVNDQETHRSVSGDCSYLTEQSMREIYLRPFEIAAKEGKTRAVMSSFNRIGTRWTGGDYRLITEILRNEWGFEGLVICDFNTIPQYMNSRQMAYAGGDLNLATDPVTWCDEGSTADVIVLRQNIQNILYAIVNSNAMNGEVIGYNMPIWQIMFIVIICVLVVGAAVWGFFVIRRALKAPDNTGKTAGADGSSSEDK